MGLPAFLLLLVSSEMQSLDFMGVELQQSSQLSADAEVYLVLKNIWNPSYQIFVSNCNLSPKRN